MSDFIRKFGDVLVEFGGKLGGNKKPKAIPEKVPTPEKISNPAQELADQTKEMFAKFSGEQSAETTAAMESLLNEAAKNGSTLTAEEAANTGDGGIGYLISRVTENGEDVIFNFFITKDKNKKKMFVRPVVSRIKIKK